MKKGSDAARQLWGAHASRVLVSVSRRDELFYAHSSGSALLTFSRFPSLLQRDAATSTRDACAPQSLQSRRIPHRHLSHE